MHWMGLGVRSVEGPHKVSDTQEDIQEDTDFRDIKKTE